MNTDRIKEIQSKTAYPDSVSVQQALLQVWNECEQERSYSEEEVIAFAKWMYDYKADINKVEELFEQFKKK